NTVTLTNGGNSGVTISAANVTGSGFSVSGLALPKTVAAGSSTTATVKFAPTTAGAASGSVAFVSNATNSPATVTLSGTGSTSSVAHAVDLAWSASTTSTVVGHHVYSGTQRAGPYALLTASAVS